MIFFVHLAATLDNWDPRIIDPIAENHHVIAFDNRGVGASTGQVPDSVEAMADDAYTFIKALGFSKVDIFSFSLGGFVAQALVVKHPDLVRKLALTGTGPKGGKDIDKVAGVTYLYLDMLRGALTRLDPKEFLFFNRNATGKPAARGGIGVRAGCHCAHLTVKQMLGIPPWAQQFQGVMLTLRRMELPGVVRVSLGIENSEDDVDTLLRVLGEIARHSGGKTDKKAARRQMDDFAETAARRVYAESA